MAGGILDDLVLGLEDGQVETSNDGISKPEIPHHVYPGSRLPARSSGLGPVNMQHQVMEGIATG